RSGARELRRGAGAVSEGGAERLSRSRQRARDHSEARRGEYRAADRRDGAAGRLDPLADALRQRPRQLHRDPDGGSGPVRTAVAAGADQWRRTACARGPVPRARRRLAAMKKHHEEPKRLKRKKYEEELQQLQVKLCALQAWVKAKGLRVVIVFEG